MKAHDVVFIKKDGKPRKMTFLKLEQMDKSFLQEQMTGKTSGRTQPVGMELVWDIVNEGFRIVNWNTMKEYTEILLDNSRVSGMIDKKWIKG